MLKVAKRRIGNGTGYQATGVVLLALGVVGNCSGTAAMDAGLAAAGMIGLVLGAAFLAIGFWIRLFGALEQRLMDIQVALARDSQTDPDEAGTPRLD